MPYLKKRLGQHHLKQGDICRPLVEFLHGSGSLVVEIGPGGGVLTQQLLADGAQVIGLEFDMSWAVTLRSRVPDKHLGLVVCDALQFDWSRLPVGTLLAGNLPFGISTRLIDMTLRQGRSIPRAGFMIQKEVADRLLAAPGQKSYGGLTVLTAARSTVSSLGRVAAGSFHPPPKVDAAFIGLETISPVVSPDEWEEFESTVHLAFSQRRKQIRNVLASRWSHRLVDNVLDRAEMIPTRRAEELSLEDFVRLFHAYKKQ